MIRSLLSSRTTIAVAASIVAAGLVTSITAGATARSIDSIPPRVVISAPSAHATLAGVVAVSGVARDNRRVEKVQVQLDDNTTRTAVGTTGWSYPLDTRAVEDGTHVVKATAYDAVGNAWSTSIAVEVRNTSAAATDASGGAPSTDNPASGSAAPSAPPVAHTESVAPAPAPAASSNVTAQARSPWSALVSWNVPAGGATVRVSRDGLLLEQAATSAGSSMTDRLLWPQRSFTYRVVVASSSGATLLDESASVTTPKATSSVPRLYAASSFWNQPISSGAAVDPASATMVKKSFVNYRSGANFSNSKSWGVPLAYATELSKTYNVGCTKYDCSRSVSFRIPSYAAPASGSDAHLSVVDPSNGGELDAWQAKPAWSASSRYLTTSTGSGALCSSGQHCNAANAAGFALLGGVARPEEIAQGHIDHALFITSPYLRPGYIACPATHTDGRGGDASAVPEGARIQLDPSFNVDAQSWPQWQKVIAHALQTYGAYVGDFGGSVSIRGESQTSRGYDAWSLAGVSGSGLSSLPWERMRVLKITQC